MSDALQFKAMSGQLSVDEAQGVVECFVAAVGNKDSVGDIVMPGAFNSSLRRRKPRVVWGHDWNKPIGKVIDMYEVPASDPRLPAKMKKAGVGGLFAKVQFNLRSERGREAFNDILFFGEEQEWSIGYKTLDSIYSSQRQANLLKELELYEVSPVLHGANQLTATISIKSEDQSENRVDSFRKSEWNLFDPEFAQMIKEKYPSIWAKGGNIRGNDQYAKLLPIAKRGGKATSETEIAALELREAWVARHKGDFRLPGVVAQIKWLAVGSRGEGYMKDVIREAIDKLEAQDKKGEPMQEMAEELMRFIAERYGDKYSIRIEEDEDPENEDEEYFGSEAPYVPGPGAGMAAHDDDDDEEGHGGCHCGCGMKDGNDVKAFGRGIGVWKNGPKTPVDADGDGMVFDGTPQEQRFTPRATSRSRQSTGRAYWIDKQKTRAQIEEDGSGYVELRDGGRYPIGGFDDPKAMDKVPKEFRRNVQLLRDRQNTRNRLEAVRNRMLSGGKSADSELLDELELKVGRAVSSRNIRRLNDAISLLNEVLSEADGSAGLESKGDDYLVLGTSPEAMFGLKSLLDPIAEEFGAAMTLDTAEGAWIAIKADDQELIDAITLLIEDRGEELSVKSLDLYELEDGDAVPFDLKSLFGRARGLRPGARKPGRGGRSGIGRNTRKLVRAAVDPKARDADGDGMVQEGTTAMRKLTKKPQEPDLDELAKRVAKLNPDDGRSPDPTKPIGASLPSSVAKLINGDPKRTAEYVSGVAKGPRRAKKPKFTPSMKRVTMRDHADNVDFSPVRRKRNGASTPTVLETVIGRDGGSIPGSRFNSKKQWIVAEPGEPRLLRNGDIVATQLYSLPKTPKRDAKPEVISLDAKDEVLAPIGKADIAGKIAEDVKFHRTHVDMDVIDDQAWTVARRFEKGNPAERKSVLDEREQIKDDIAFWEKAASDVYEEGGSVAQHDWAQQGLAAATQRQLAQERAERMIHDSLSRSGKDDPAAEKLLSELPDDWHTTATVRRNGLPGPDEFAKMKRDDGPLGSQGGRWYSDADGQRYLVKPAKSEAHAQNELAAHLFYKEAGLATDDTGIYEHKGRWYIAKKAVQDKNGKLGKIIGDDGMTADLQEQAREGFAYDALASSWDVFGLVGDNVILDEDGTIHRIDVGGSMQFRAMGGDKGSFNRGEAWTEPFSMRSSDQGRTFYGDMSDDEAYERLAELADFDIEGYTTAMKDAGIDDDTLNRISSTMYDRIGTQLPGILEQLTPEDEAWAPSPFSPVKSDDAYISKAKGRVNEALTDLWDRIDEGPEKNLPSMYTDVNQMLPELTSGNIANRLGTRMYISGDKKNVMLTSTRGGATDVLMLRRDGKNLDAPELQSFPEKLTPKDRKEIEKLLGGSDGIVYRGGVDSGFPITAVIDNERQTPDGLVAKGSSKEFTDLISETFVPPDLRDDVDGDWDTLYEEAKIDWDDDRMNAYGALSIDDIMESGWIFDEEDDVEQWDRHVEDAREKLTSFMDDLNIDFGVLDGLSSAELDQLDDSARFLNMRGRLLSLLSQYNRLLK